MPKTNDLHITYNRTSKELEQLYHAYARHAGVSDAALWLLYVIRLGGNNLTQAAICADWHYPPQTINSALKRLEAQGLVALGSRLRARRSSGASSTPSSRRSDRPSPPWRPRSARRSSRSVSATSTS